MSIIRNSSTLVLAGLVLPAIFVSRASADTVLHMDINAITITATGSNGSNAFSTGFTGDLTFNTNNFSSLFTDIDGNPFVGFTGHITSFTGDISLAGGLLTGGSVAVTVETGSISDTYSYDIVTGSGQVTRSPIPIVFSALGYNLAGATDDGEFTGTDFGGVDVTTWVNDEPLPGDFFQFHYRPNAVTGVDTDGDVELYVLAIGSSNGPTVPLPTSLLSGVLGLGMLGAYRWHRGNQMKQNS
jgi:hypothetical protein